MKYHFKIHQEAKGFWAECIELEGCTTQADTIEELFDNMQTALNLYLEEPIDSKELAPLPQKIALSNSLVEIPVYPEVAFAFLMRYYRHKHGLTQKQAAEKMGFEKMYSYQRLESGRCNPSLKTMSKIKEVFPDFSLDMAIGI